MVVQSVSLLSSSKAKAKALVRVFGFENILSEHVKKQGLARISGLGAYGVVNLKSTYGITTLDQLISEYILQTSLEKKTLWLQNAASTSSNWKNNVETNLIPALEGFLEVITDKMITSIDRLSDTESLEEIIQKQDQTIVQLTAKVVEIEQMYLKGSINHHNNNSNNSHNNNNSNNSHNNCNNIPPPPPPPMMMMTKKATTSLTLSNQQVVKSNNITTIKQQPKKRKSLQEEIQEGKSKKIRDLIEINKEEINKCVLQLKESISNPKTSIKDKYLSIQKCESILCKYDIDTDFKLLESEFTWPTTQVALIRGCQNIMNLFKEKVTKLEEFSKTKTMQKMAPQELIDKSSTVVTNALKALQEMKTPGDPELWELVVKKKVVDIVSENEPLVNTCSKLVQGMQDDIFTLCQSRYEESNALKSKTSSSKRDDINKKNYIISSYEILQLALEKMFGNIAITEQYHLKSTIMIQRMEQEHPWIQEHFS